MTTSRRRLGTKCYSLSRSLEIRSISRGSPATRLTCHRAAGASDRRRRLRKCGQQHGFPASRHPGCFLWIPSHDGEWRMAPLHLTGFQLCCIYHVQLREQQDQLPRAQRPPAAALWFGHRQPEWHSGQQRSSPSAQACRIWFRPAAIHKLQLSELILGCLVVIAANTTASDEVMVSRR